MASAERESVESVVERFSRIYDCVERVGERRWSLSWWRRLRKGRIQAIGRKQGPSSEELVLDRLLIEEEGKCGCVTVTWQN